MRKIKWAIIGSGGISKRRTIPEGFAKASNARLEVVYDLNPEINRELAKEFNAVAATDIKQILSSNVDAVYIATPANLHHQQALACASVGKHVLCEKPLGLTVGEAQDMDRVFKTKNLQLGVAFMMRFHSQHQQALKMIHDGLLGKLVYGRAQLSCWYPPIDRAWRQDKSISGGGSLMDMGGHCIDLLEMFLGHASEVSCFINNSIHRYDSEDSAVATIRFKNGALATVDTFFCIPDQSTKNVLEIYGSKGSIYAEGTIGQTSKGNMVALIQETSSGYDSQQKRDISNAIQINPKPVNTYRAEIEEFSKALMEGREPINGSSLGLQSQIILDACYQSAAKKKVIIIN